MPKKTVKKTAKKAAAKKAAKKATKKTAKKTAKKAPSKTAKKTAKKVTKTKETAVSHEEISHLAYLNFVNRLENGHDGNEQSDWLSAELSLKKKK